MDTELIQQASGKSKPIPLTTMLKVIRSGMVLLFKFMPGTLINLNSTILQLKPVLKRLPGQKTYTSPVRLFVGIKILSRAEL